MKRLLIMSCSDSKVTTSSPVKPLDLYNGPMYQTLRAFQRQNPSPDVRIISAKYGWLRPDDVITGYDQKMTPERALELQPEIRRKLQDAAGYDEVFLMMGELYLSAIGPLDLFGDARVIHPPGGLLSKRKQFKSWLYAAA